MALISSTRPRVNDAALRRQLDAARTASPTTRAKQRNLVILALLPITRWATKKFAPSTMQADEATSRAATAVLIAVDKALLQPVKGSLVSYVVTAVKNTLWTKAGTSPTPDMVTGLDEPLLLHVPREHKRRDVAVGRVLEQTLYPAPDAGFNDRDLQRQVKALLDAALPPLSSEERTVVRMKLGWVSGTEMDLFDIAKDLDLSLTMVQHLSASAMQKLRAGAAQSTRVAS